MLASAAPHLSQPLRRPPGRARASCSPTTTAPMPPRSICTRAGVAVEAIVDLRARHARRAAAARPRRRACAILRGSAVVGTDGRRRIIARLGRRRCAPMAARVDRASRRPCAATACSSPAAGTRPSTCSRSRAASCASTTQLAAFVPDQSVQPERSAGAAGGSLSLAACFAEGCAGRCSTPPGPPASAATRRTAPTVREPAAGPLLPTWVGAEPRSPRAKAFVDFQNDVTAKDLGLAVREGFQSIEHVKRYTTTGMGTDQGKTSNVNALAIVAGKRGITIEAVGTTTFRPPYTPVTVRRPRRPAQRRAVRPDPPHAEPRLGDGAGRACSRMSATGSARATSRKPARTCTRRCSASAARCAQGVGLFDAQHAGQDRPAGPGRRRAPEPRLHQRLDQARGRPLPLRADAARRRHGVRRRRHRAARPRPLPHDHDHRRRAARAGLARGVAADRVAGARGLLHLGHRAVGGDGRGRAEGARACCAPSARTSTSPTTRFPHLAFKRGHGRRHPGARVPDQLLRRDRLRGQRALGLRRGACGRRCGRRASRSASRPTAPRACTCCAPRRATSSSARTPTAR